MTINLADNTPRVSYAVAAGVTQTSFTVSFEFFDDADLNVYVDGTLKTLTTDYTVTGGDGATGSIAARSLPVLVAVALWLLLVTLTLLRLLTSLLLVLSKLGL